MTNSTDEQQPEKKRRRRRAKVDVHQLRRDLLATCSRYLDEVPLQEMNGSLLKAIGEIVNSTGPEYEKHERNASPSQTLAGWHAPFAVEGTEQPTGVLPPPGYATPANGFPSVPLPSVKGDGGGIREATGLQRPE